MVGRDDLASTLLLPICVIGVICGFKSGFRALGVNSVKSGPSFSDTKLAEDSPQQVLGIDLTDHLTNGIKGFAQLNRDKFR